MFFRSRSARRSGYRVPRQSVANPKLAVQSASQIDPRTIVLPKDGNVAEPDASGNDSGWQKRKLARRWALPKNLLEGGLQGLPGFLIGVGIIGDVLHPQLIRSGNSETMHGIRINHELIVDFALGKRCLQLLNRLCGNEFILAAVENQDFGFWAKIVFLNDFMYLSMLVFLIRSYI